MKGVSQQRRQEYMEDRRQLPIPGQHDKFDKAPQPPPRDRYKDWSWES